MWNFRNEISISIEQNGQIAAWLLLFHGNIIIDWIDFLLNELVSRSKIENSIIHSVLGKMTMNPSNIIIVPFNYIFMSYSMKVRTTTTVRNDEKLCHTRNYVGIFVVSISWLVLLVHLQLRCIGAVQCTCTHQKYNLKFIRREIHDAIETFTDTHSARVRERTWIKRCSLVIRIIICYEVCRQKVL